MRCEHGKGGHGVNWKRLGNRRGEGLGKEGDSALGFGIGREVFGLEAAVILTDEEDRSAKSALALRLGRNLVIEQALDVVDGEL